MSRRLRIELSHGLYHVMSRGLEHRSIVRDDADRKEWTDLLRKVATRRGWQVFASPRMDNDFHIFMRIPESDLSARMHDLTSGYGARWT